MFIRLVKIGWCQTFFCQVNLTKPLISLDNRLVLILLLMAGMRMAALAAGFGAALAGGSQEANAQATEIMIPLDSGEEIVMNVVNVQYETQVAIMNHLEACIGAAEKSRNDCVAEAATLMATERLDGTVRKAHQEIEPLEAEIGFSSAQIIGKPEFCDFAASDAGFDTCQQETEAVQRAALGLQIAVVREGRIAAETREAEIDQAIAKVETSDVNLDEAIETSKAEGSALDRIGTEQAETIDAYAAVLAALQRVAAENKVTN